MNIKNIAKKASALTVAAALLAGGAPQTFAKETQDYNGAPPASSAAATVKADAFLAMFLMFINISSLFQYVIDCF